MISEVIRSGVLKIIHYSSGFGILSVLFFVFFLLVAYYVFQVLQSALVVTVLSILFPFISNSVFGTNFPTDLSSLGIYITLGLALLAVYELLKWLTRVSKLLAWLLGIIIAPFVALASFIRRLVFGKRKNK